MLYKQEYISIAHWNINGIGNKLNNIDFVQNIKNLNVCFMTETWLQKRTCINVEDKFIFSKDAIKHNNKKGRKSGGIMVIIYKVWKPFKKLVDKKCDYGIWIKVNSQSTKNNSKEDIYICGFYIPPENSPYSYSYWRCKC